MATDTVSTGIVSTEPTAVAAADVHQPMPSPVPTAWLGAFIGAVIVLAFAPLLQVHAQHLWERPHYQFFPLVLLGSAVLAWSYWRARPLAPTAGNGGWTIAGFAVAWALLAGAEVFLSPPLAAVAFLILIAALILGIGGMPLFRTLLPAWVFLWFTVRPPLALDSRLITALQDLTSRWSSAVLDTLGVLHLPDGNVVEISGRRLLVEEACSGISSLFSVLACTVFLIFWLRRPLLRSLLLIVAAIGWVLIANVVRVATVAFVFDRWGVDLSLGAKHDLLGFACFALAVLLIWSSDRFSLFLVPLRTAANVPPPAQPVPVREALGACARLMSWPMAVAFGLLLMLHVATYGVTAADTPHHELLPGIAQLGEQSLSENLAGWKRERYYTETRDHLSEFGENSKVWVYKLDQRTALVSLDYPFPIFHLLNTCYVNQGWQVERSTDFLGEKAEGEPGFYVEVRLKKSALRVGTLFYCECSQGGDYLEHEGDMLRSAWNRYESAMTAWRHRLARPAETAAATRPRRPAYQFQLFIEGNRPLTAGEHEAVQRLFFQSVQGLRKELYPGSPP